MEFPGGLLFEDPRVVTAVVWIQSLAQEHLHAVGMAKKEERSHNIRNMEKYKGKYKLKK